MPQGRIVVPEMTVRDNLMIGAHILGNDRAAIEAAIERVLQLFPALKPRMKQQADTMSGGEQQMLAIGRALMTSPKIIMLDEPSLGLVAQIRRDRLREAAVAARRRHDGRDGRAEGLACALASPTAAMSCISDRSPIEGSARELLANDDVKRLFLGEIPESMKALSLTDA